MSNKKKLINEKYQVLTDKGWINISMLTNDLKIATLVDGKYLSYEQPIGLYQIDYEGMLYKVHNKNIDIDVGEDHELFVMGTDEKQYTFKKASDIIGKQIMYKKDCFTRDKKDVAIFKTNNKYGSFSCPMDIWLDFLGSFIARGTTQNNLIKIKWNTRFAERIKELSEDMKLEFEKEGKYVNMNTTYIIKNDILFEYLKNSNNLLPAFVWELSMRQARILLDSLVACDSLGQFEKCYYTKNERQADEIMRLALHAGVIANLDKIMVHKNDKYGKSPMIKVTIFYNKDIIPSNIGSLDDKMIKFKGVLYSIEVPSNVIYVRSRTITGSCKGIWL